MVSCICLNILNNVEYCIKVMWVYTHIYIQVCKQPSLNTYIYTCIKNVKQLYFYKKNGLRECIKTFIQLMSLKYNWRNRPLNECHHQFTKVPLMINNVRNHPFAHEFWTKNRLFLRPQLSLKSKTITNQERIGCLVYPEITQISKRSL